MSSHNRRTFLKRAAATAGIGTAFAISGTKASGQVLGANDRVRVAVAGINGRGRSFLAGFGGMKDVEIAYLVDPDSRLFASRRDYVTKKSGYTPACVQDVRRALDDKDLDAIAIVTPNHWHALMGIWACQAGKDAYVEKPCSHNLFEGRQLVAAARKYDRLVQHGTQRRSDPKWIQLTNDVRNGKYGKLQVAHALDYRPRPSNGIEQPQAPPPNWTSTCIWARRLSSRSARISCTTAGTGGGTSATARSETWGHTIWMSADGSCPKVPHRRAWSASAAASAIWTKAKRPTPI